MVKITVRIAYLSVQEGKGLLLRFEILCAHNSNMGVDV